MAESLNLSKSTKSPTSLLRTKVMLGDFVSTEGGDTALTNAYIMRKSGTSHDYEYMMMLPSNPVAVNPAQDKFGAKITLQAPVLVLGTTPPNEYTANHIKCFLQYMMDWKDAIKAIMSSQQLMDYIIFNTKLEDLVAVERKFRPDIQMYISQAKDTVNTTALILGVNGSPGKKEKLWHGNMKFTEFDKTEGEIKIVDYTQVKEGKEPEKMVWAGRFDLLNRTILTFLLEKTPLMYVNGSNAAIPLKYAKLEVILRLLGAKALDNIVYKMMTSIDWSKVSSEDMLDALARAIVFREVMKELWNTPMYKVNVDPMKTIDILITTQIRYQNRITNAAEMQTYFRAPWATGKTSERNITWINWNAGCIDPHTPMSFEFYLAENPSKCQAKGSASLFSTRKDIDLSEINMSQYNKLPEPLIKSTADATIMGTFLKVPWKHEFDAYGVSGIVPAGELEYVRQSHFDPNESERSYIAPINLPWPKQEWSPDGLLAAILISQTSVFGGLESFTVATAQHDENGKYSLNAELKL